MSETTETLVSKQDASVNFVTRGSLKPGYTEARYVRRREDYFIAYLSSQTGCNQACRFCHLTATGQTSYVDVSVDGLVTQANQVMSWYDKEIKFGQPAAKIVHFSFMARGEPLASKTLQLEGDQVVERLHRVARDKGLLPRVMISTILPQEIKGKSLVEMFPSNHPNFYYSLYSMNPNFRKKWLPKALPAEEGLDMLRDYQEHTNKIVRLHWAFIEGENDSEEDIKAITEAVNRIKLKVDVNIVRYNPFSDKHGKEPSLEHITSLGKILTSDLPSARVKVVDRVGRDVFASCGTFVGGSDGRGIKISN